ncbi:MAG: hypothetical protein HZB57_05225 [Gammaproteobacteria bacterium]|nr:hypothetical protein [Gammaproteobacteria bacterium]
MKRSSNGSPRLNLRLPWISGIFLGLYLTIGNSHAQAQDEFTGLSVSQPTELDDLRGQSSNTQITVQSNQDLSASVTGSTFTVGTLNSGSVTIAEHALDGFSGVGVFNIVTGNNNAVNAAIGVTFNLQ